MREIEADRREGGGLRCPVCVPAIVLQVHVSPVSATHISDMPDALRTRTGTRGGLKPPQARRLVRIVRPEGDERQEF